MHVLLIRDDDQIAQFVEQRLEEAGYVVDRTGDGEEGFRIGLNEAYDAAVINRGLPSRNGLGRIHGWRKRSRNTPVLILSAKRSVDERVEGLQAGGEDYLAKPFAFAELVAQVQALVRRNAGTTELSLLTAGPIKIERDDFPDMECAPNMQIEISGEVEMAFMRQPEIDVETLTVLQETP